jgi:hypothetical protein
MSPAIDIDMQIPAKYDDGGTFSIKVVHLQEVPRAFLCE